MAEKVTKNKIPNSLQTLTRNHMQRFQGETQLKMCVEYICTKISSPQAITYQTLFTTVHLHRIHLHKDGLSRA